MKKRRDVVFIEFIQDGYPNRTSYVRLDQIEGIVTYGSYGDRNHRCGINTINGRIYAAGETKFSILEKIKEASQLLQDD